MLGVVGPFVWSGGRMELRLDVQTSRRLKKQGLFWVCGVVVQVDAARALTVGRLSKARVPAALRLVLVGMLATAS